MWRARSINLRYLDLKENIHTIQKDKILRNTPSDACLQILAGNSRYSNGETRRDQASQSNSYIKPPEHPFTTVVTSTNSASTEKNNSFGTFAERGISIAQSNFNERFNSFFIDYSLIPLLIQQNYIESSKFGVLKDTNLSEDQKLERLSEAADAVSDMELAGGTTT
jgi:hypothetical protein